jgi:hypothetical protein
MVCFTLHERLFSSFSVAFKLNKVPFLFPAGTRTQIPSTMCTVSIRHCPRGPAFRPLWTAHLRPVDSLALLRRAGSSTSLAAKAVQTVSGTSARPLTSACASDAWPQDGVYHMMHCKGASVLVHDSMVQSPGLHPRGAAACSLMCLGLERSSINNFVYKYK